LTRAFRLEKDHVALFVRVTPNASKDEIRGLWRGPDNEERLAVRVTAPPDKGRANKAVLKLIGGALGLSKSALSIAGGEKDRMKTIAIAARADDVVSALEALIGEAGSGADA
jgi:hypothetical protein